jgi:hypothetical protein
MINLNKQYDHLPSLPIPIPSDRGCRIETSVSFRQQIGPSFPVQTRQQFQILSISSQNIFYS